MSLFRFFWLRRFIRKNTRPIPINTAGEWKKRLAFVYMVLGWNALGIVCYAAYMGKLDWARYHGLKSESEANMPAGQAWAKTLSLSNVHVYSYSGISKKGEYSLKDGEIVDDKKDDVDKK